MKENEKPEESSDLFVYFSVVVRFLFPAAILNASYVQTARVRE